jgi:RNA polymerase sigma factor for flagellar operon FliA
MDEAQLWRDYARRPCVETRNALAECYLPLVERIAGKLQRGLPASVEVGDLLSAGTIGLLQAIEAFDPDRGLRFATFAPWRIKGAMHDWLREIDWVPRLARSRERAGTEQPVQVGSLFRVTARSGESWADRTVADDLAEPRADAAAQRSAADDAWRELLRGLSKTERLLLLLLYREQLTMQAVGRQLGLSESRVSQVHTALVRRLRERHGVPADVAPVRFFGRRRKRPRKARKDAAVIETNWSHLRGAFEVARDVDDDDDLDEPRCFVCSCTEDAACEGGCAWVPDPDGEMRDICSACVDVRPWLPRHDDELRSCWDNTPLLKLAKRLCREPETIIERGGELGLYDPRELPEGLAQSREAAKSST